MKKIIAAAAVTLTLAAVPAFAGEGNGDPFALRTPPIVSTTVAVGPDAGAEDTPDLNAAFARPEAWTGLAAGAGAATVQTADSPPAGTLGVAPAYAPAARGSFAAR